MTLEGPVVESAEELLPQGNTGPSRQEINLKGGDGGEVQEDATATS